MVMIVIMFMMTMMAMMTAMFTVLIKICDIDIDYYDDTPHQNTRMMMMMTSLTAMVTILVKRCATCGKLESIHRDETTNVYLHK